MATPTYKEARKRIEDWLSVRTQDSHITVPDVVALLAELDRRSNDGLEGAWRHRMYEMVLDLDKRVAELAAPKRGLTHKDCGGEYYIVGREFVNVAYPNVDVYECRLCHERTLQPDAVEFDQFEAAGGR